MAGIDQRDRIEAGTEPQATFIVRVRHERGTPAGEWRGEVEHVQTARLVRFADPAGLSAFVWSQLADAESRPGVPGGVAERRGAPAADPESEVERCAHQLSESS